MLMLAMVAAWLGRVVTGLSVLKSASHFVEGDSVLLPWLSVPQELPIGLIALDVIWGGEK